MFPVTLPFGTYFCTAQEDSNYNYDQGLCEDPVG